MLEDVFDRLASTSNSAGKELLEILKKRRQRYEKYPEELVLINVFNELLQKRNKNVQNKHTLEPVQSLLDREFNLLAQIIYEDNAYRQMQDCAVNKETFKDIWRDLIADDKKYQEKCQKMGENAYRLSPYIRRPATAKAKGLYDIYWERFHYEQGQETTWRVALNVLPEKKLLEKIDKLAQKYHCTWKYVNRVNEYNRRTDPIIVYFPKETEKNKESILNEISQIIKPYVRTDKYEIFGYQNKRNGIYYAEFPTPERLQKALARCVGEEYYKECATISQTDDEFRENILKGLRPDTLQYFLASRILNGKGFSGGQLAIHEWLIDAYRTTQEKTHIHYRDGTAVHKCRECVWKTQGEKKKLWHRWYHNNFHHYTERLHYENGVWQSMKKNILTFKTR